MGTWLVTSHKEQPPSYVTPTYVTSTYSTGRSML